MTLSARHTLLLFLRSLPMRPSVCLRCAVLSLLPLLLASCHHYSHPEQPASQLSFGVNMAQHGLWSEALFRFHQAESLDPNNPRIQNDLAVAYEAAGDYDKALESYKKGLKLDPNSKELRANYARFVEFYQGFKSSDKPVQGSAGAFPPSRPVARPAPPPEMAPPPIGAPMGIPQPPPLEPPPPTSVER
jgi:tetratricopeptide (TPR) repeat protein